MTEQLDKEARGVFKRKKSAPAVGETQKPISEGFPFGIFFLTLLILGTLTAAYYAYGSDKTRSDNSRSERSRPEKSGSEKSRSSGAKASEGRQDQQASAKDQDRAKQGDTEQPAGQNDDVRTLVISRIEKAVDEIEKELKQKTYSTGAELSGNGSPAVQASSSEVDSAVKGTLQEISIVLDEVRQNLAAIAKKDPNEQRTVEQKRKQADALREQSKRERESGDR